MGVGIGADVGGGAAVMGATCNGEGWAIADAGGGEASRSAVEDETTVEEDG